MPSFFRLQAAMYLKRAAILLAVLVVAALLYFSLLGGDWKKTRESLTFWKSKPQTEEPFLDTKEKQDFGSFEEFLARSNQQQLIGRLEDLEVEPNDNMAVHLDNQKKKIRIADKLIEMKDDPQAEKYGIQTKLTSLRMREIFKFDNGVSSEVTVAELIEFAEEHLTSAEPDIEIQAQLGQLVGLLIGEFVRADEPDFTMPPRLLSMFTDISKQNINDLTVSTELFELLERIYVHTPASQNKQYIESFRDIYSKSENENLTKLSALIAQKLNESEFELVNIFDSVESEQLESAEKLRAQISDALELPTISEQGYGRLFSGIRDITRLRQFEVAAELTRKLQSRVEKEPGLKRLVDINAMYLNQLELAGKEFDFTGVVSMADRPFSIRFPDADLKAVLFMTHQTFEQADKTMFEMLKIAGQRVTTQKFCISAVFLDPGTFTQATEGIRKASEAVSNVDFCRVDIQSEDGQKLMERISLLWSPMLILLDRENKVVGINVTQADFEKDFFELSGN